MSHRKRQRAPGSSGESPFNKKELKTLLEEFLIRHLKYEENLFILKSDLFNMCLSEFTEAQLTNGGLLTRSLKKVIVPSERRGARITSHGNNNDYSTQYWVHVTRRVTPEDDPKNDDLVDNTDDPTNDDNDDWVDIADESPDKTTKKDTCPLRFLKHPMRVTAEEATALSHLRNERYEQGLNILLGKDNLHHIAHSITCKALRSEVKAYAKDDKSIMKRVKTADLTAFDFQKLDAETTNKLPFLKETIKSVTLKPVMGSVKTEESCMPAINSVIAKCLGIYSNNMSAYKSCLSSILINGGATNTCMNQLAALYDCTPKTSRDRKQLQFAADYADTVNKWMAKDESFTIAFDNVDKHIKGRHSKVKEAAKAGVKAKSTNSMAHMIQSLAFRDRVPYNAASPTLPRDKPEQVQSESLLPTPGDESTLRNAYARVVRQIWAANIPSLSWMKPQPGSEDHEFSQYTASVSEIVNLGVEKRSETSHQDMVAMLDFYHSFVKSDDIDQPITIPLAGDWLSMKAGQRAQMAQADGETPSERRDGLVCIMADFHAQMALLRLIYKLLFDSKSSSDIGSLYSCKNLIDAKNVSGDAGKDFYPCAELVDNVTTAYVVIAGMNHFKLSAVNGSSEECREPYERQDETANEIAHAFVERYCILDVLADISNKKKCPVCHSEYASTLKLKDHYKAKHTGEHIASDLVSEHTSILLTLGLMKMTHDRAIQLGNGGLLMTLYKWMMLWFDRNDMSNYSTGLLELQYQLKVLPDYLTHAIVWNRFVNTKGKADSNIPMDLHVEHRNGWFKQNIATYRGEFTIEALRKLARGSNARNVIVEKFYATTSAFKPGGKNVESEESRRKKLMTLLEHLEPEDLMGSSSDGRHFSIVSSCNLLRNSRLHVRSWADAKLDVWSTKHYYQYHNPDYDSWQ